MTTMMRHAIEQGYADGTRQAHVYSPTSSMTTTNMAKKACHVMGCYYGKQIKAYVDAYCDAIIAEWKRMI